MLRRLKDRGDALGVVILVSCSNCLFGSDKRNRGTDKQGLTDP